MSDSLVPDILQHLNQVQAARDRQRNHPQLARNVAVIKSYQASRFKITYADLQSMPRYRPAIDFFLAELYGPTDYKRRDEQFARIVPSVVRLFPEALARTITALAQLHALSELLDEEMAALLDDQLIGPAVYCALWQQCGRPGDRQTQIELTVKVALALDKHTGNRLLRSALRLMKGPAEAAGLSELQTFLENGFNAFGQMRGADEFISTIQLRESALAAALDSADLARFSGEENTRTDAQRNLLYQLPA